MQKHIWFCAKWILMLSLVGFCGCANKILQSDFTNYSAIYGDESNKQLLLNLARLANDDPVYYIQLGSISSQYQITTSLQFTSGNTRTTTEPVGSAGGNIPKQVANALALSGQANLGAVQTPIFSFVPLTGTNMVQAVLTPINDKVYLTFYDQGFDADLIARTIISQVEWQHVYTNMNHANFTTGGITIQTKGVDPKLITYIANSVPNYAVSYDTNAYLVRTKLMTDTNNLLAEITNSIISSNDISWGMNSFIVQGKVPNTITPTEMTISESAGVISIYTNSITIQTTNFDAIDTNFLSFIQTIVPASALTVSKIIVNANSIPQNVLALTNNAALTSAITNNGGKYSISLALLGPDMAAYITNSIFTNCVTVTTNYEILVNNPGSPTYWKFLQFCSDLYDAQVCRMLNVDNLSGGTTTTNVIYGKDRRNPALADVVSAIGANLSVTADTNRNIIVSQTQQTPHFTEKGSLISTNFQEYAKKFSYATNNINDFTYDTGPATLNADPAVVKMIDASNLVQDIINKRVTAKTRTFESAMYWVAQQEHAFEDNETNTSDNPSPSYISYTNDNDGFYAIITAPDGNDVFITNTISTNCYTRFFCNSSLITLTNGESALSTNIAYRQIKIRPTMTFTFPRHDTKPLLCSIKYGGKDYKVTDANRDDRNSNQEVFTMLSYLFAQTAISTQNLPVQQLIQVQ